MDPVDVLRERFASRRRAQLRERERAVARFRALVRVAQARQSAAVVACFVPSARPHVDEYVDSATDAVESLRELLPDLARAATAPVDVMNVWDLRREHVRNVFDGEAF